MMLDQLIRRARCAVGLEIRGRRAGHDGDRRQGAADPQGRDAEGPPAHLLRGQLLHRHAAGQPQRSRAGGRRSDPDHANCDRREDLVAARTQATNRLRWRLTELDPDLEPPLRSLHTRRTQTRLEARLGALPASVTRDLALELLADITRLSVRIIELERRITELVTPLAPALLAIVGVGPITAATILGQVAGVARFRSRAAFAMHTGTAPIPVWSGNAAYRLNRGGNRTLNCCLHTIAITQLAHHEPAKGFVRQHRQRRPNTTPKTAIRALKRHLSDVVYDALRQDLRAQQDQQTQVA